MDFPPSSPGRVAHGRDKEPEPDDPMTLSGIAVPAGDPEIMARCIVEEYARMGWGRDTILELFRDPNYRTHALWRERGRAWVERLVDDRLARTGVTRAVEKGEGSACGLQAALERRPSGRGMPGSKEETDASGS